MRAVVFAGFFLLASVTSSAQLSPYHQLGRDVLEEMIETKTPTSVGITALSEKIAARFKAAGFPAGDIHVLGASDRNKNVVVRYRGAGKQKPTSAEATAGKPILLLGHLDVVEARREDWSFDPFVLTEQGGYFYGRGTEDVKGGDTMLVAALLRLKSEGFVPNRDLILALTADEEAGIDNGVQWLLANRRDLVDAEFCINFDGGGGEIVNGKKTTFGIQAAEKIYQSFTFTVKNPGGHSSLPVRENAIYRLSAALQRLAAHEFPRRLNPVTKMYFDKKGSSGSPTLDHALTHTTCVATMLDAGHAENALPQTARATVNCRLLPDGQDDALATLKKVVADPQVEIAAIAPPRPSPPSIPPPELLATIERITASIWGKVLVVPFMATGATDGLYLRNAGIPVFGINGQFGDVDDVRAHGKDERIPVREFYQALDFSYALLRAIAAD
jgi:acetylornithine deacetylase/succinyl-diaminopimelate desuccinylase-like protein